MTGLEDARDVAGHMDRLDPRGSYRVEHVRDGAVIGVLDFPNAVTNLGKNTLLDVYFNSGLHQTSWSIGLIDNATFTAVNPADVMSGHAGWSEFTAYTIAGVGTFRGAWGQGSAAGQQVSNASPVVVDFTANGSLYGIFVASDGTKSGTTGTLWSTAPFSSALAVLIGDQLRVTYTVQL